MRAALQVMTPVLRCWPTISAEGISGMKAEAEPSWKYTVTFCCHGKDSHRGAVWQNSVWCGSAYEAKVCHWIHPFREKKKKNCTQWHSLMLALHLWRSNSGCEHNEAMGGQFQQWHQRQWVTSTGADFYKCGMQALVHHWWKCIANGGDYVEN